MAKKPKADEVAAVPPADEVVPPADEVVVVPPADEMPLSTDEVAATVLLDTCAWPERVSYLDQLDALIAASETTAEKGVYEELQVILSDALMKVKAVSRKVADDKSHIAHDIEALFKG